MSVRCLGVRCHVVGWFDGRSQPTDNCNYDPHSFLAPGLCVCVAVGGLSVATEVAGCWHSASNGNGRTHARHFTHAFTRPVVHSFTDCLGNGRAAYHYTATIANGRIHCHSLTAAAIADTGTSLP